MKKIVFMVLVSISLFAGADMCLYYYQQIPPAQKKASMALERGDKSYAAAWAEQVVRSAEGALSECEGAVPVKYIEDLKKIREIYTKPVQ